MSARPATVLRCDGHSRVGPCEHDYLAVAGGLAEARRLAAAAGWRAVRVSPGRGGHTLDYCPEHLPA